jgi:hypothetical protein
MASAPVREYIGRRAGVPADLIRATTPRTPNAPRPFQTAENKKKTTDLLASTEQYRLNIDANPTVPVLKIFAQATSARSAAELANAAVDGLRDYLQQVARTQGIDERTQVRVVQLGRARGAVINGGVNVQLTVLAFLFFFSLTSAAAIFMARVRRGFQLADEQQHAQPVTGEAPSQLAAAAYAVDRDLVAP